MEPQNNRSNKAFGAGGTPGGVGMAMRPPRFLAPGDVVRVEIERIGHIENRVVDEPDDTARL